MEWEIRHRPVFSVLEVKLEPGEEIVVEPGAYMMHFGEVEVKTSARGGMLSSLARRIAGGESVFMNTIRGGKSGARVWIAPSVPGDITHIRIRPGEAYYVQDSSFLACHGEVKLTVAWRGLKGLLAEGELVWLKLEGMGDAWVNSYGCLEKLSLKPGEKAVIDNGHLVAMSGNIGWRIRKFGGLKTLLLGGEGLVVEVEGPGELIVQTRTLPAFASVLLPFLRKAK